MRRPRGWVGRRRTLVSVALAVGMLAAGCTSGGSSGAPTATAVSSAAGTSTAESSTAVSPTAVSPTAESSGAVAVASDWPAYHGDSARTGYSAAMPAASGRLTAVKVPLDGQVYASPIVVGGTVIVATEKNVVYGLTASGAIRWQVDLGTPTNRSDLPCGNIDPLGITGTPVYDAVSRSMFLVASMGSAASHVLVSLDPTTGKVRWRHAIDLPGTDQKAMQERGALSVLGGRVWVPFGGLAGDCGAYKGRLIGVPVGDGTPISYTVPTTREAGIWTPPGATVFGGNLLVAVGNGESVGTTYDYSDSVLKVSPEANLIDSYSPSTWASDNAADLDLGSQGPAVVSGKWVFTAGKSGQAYVLKVTDLGGAGRLGAIGGEVSQAAVCKSFAGTAVVADTVYVPCADGLRAVRISAAGTMTVLWHAGSSVQGSPVVGGGRVYSLAQSDGVLHALDPATGRSREQVSVGKTSRFATPAVSGRTLYVPTLAGITIVQS